MYVVYDNTFRCIAQKEGPQSSNCATNTTPLSVRFCAALSMHNTHRTLRPVCSRGQLRLRHQLPIQARPRPRVNGPKFTSERFSSALTDPPLQAKAPSLLYVEVPRGTGCKIPSPSRPSSESRQSPRCLLSALRQRRPSVLRTRSRLRTLFPPSCLECFQWTDPPPEWSLRPFRSAGICVRIDDTL